MKRPCLPSPDLPAPSAPRALRWAARCAVVPAVLAVLIVPMAGCASSTAPGYDGVLGDAVRALNAQQLLDPRAPRRHADAVPPSDGRTVREAMDRQLESYRNASPARAVGLGGTGNGN